MISEGKWSKLSENGIRVDIPTGPKFSIGDKVSHLETLYGETEGKIVEIEKIFTDIYKDGSFVPDGLSHIESSIKSIQIPYTFDGETLTIEYPEATFGEFVTPAYTKVAKFKNYAYTVETLEMRTLWSEKQLRLRKTT